MDGELIAGAADALRGAGALDVVLVPTLMKKGRPGVRVEVLVSAALADRLEELLFAHTTSIGVRRTLVERHSLPREVRTVDVLGRSVRVKVVTTPSGTHHAKPEFDDVARVAAETGRALRDIAGLARDEAERVLSQGVF